MNLRILLVAGLAGMSLAAFACSSSEEDSTPKNTSNPTSKTPPFEAEKHTNGKAISESEACTRYVAALAKRNGALGCGLEDKTCPSFLRGAISEKLWCADYDEGVVDACLQHISALSCDELKTRPCNLIYFSGTETGETVCSNTGKGGAGGSEQGGAGGEGGSTTAGAGGEAAGGEGGSTTAGAGGEAAGGEGGSTTAGAGGEAAGGEAGGEQGGEAGGEQGGEAGGEQGGEAGGEGGLNEETPPSATLGGVMG